MAERLYLGGVTDTVIHTETDGTIHVEERQDCQGILDWTQACRNTQFSGSDVMDGLARYEGEVPVTKYLEEAKRRGYDKHRAMQILGSHEGDLILLSVLYDPENANLRVAPTLRDPHVIVKGAR